MKARKEVLGFESQIDFEQILSNPILDIAARLWEDERYEAFKVCYQSMRVVDDFVDNRKATVCRISEIEKKIYVTKIDDWLRQVEGKVENGTFQKKLTDTRNRFRIPIWHWQKFSKAMIYDIEHSGFKTFNDFLNYSEGAAVAPASIFMHLCGVSKENGHYRQPEFDIEEVARPIAIFAYLTHIFRDFQEDQKNNLNYMAENLMAENGLNISMLREIASGGRIKSGFRSLMLKYYNHAERNRQKAREVLDKTSNHLEPQYQLSLEIIYNLYLQIFDKIDISNGRFTTLELSPSPDDVQDRIRTVIESHKDLKKKG